jgi:hypothetical protein
MSTFTPVPPDFTPEVIQTQSARQTEAAQVSPEASNATPTAPPAITPNGSAVTPNGSPVATTQPGEIRPPDAIFRSNSGQAAGAIGNSNFVDPATETGATISAPYVPLPDGAAGWPVNSEARIEVPNSPYAVRSAMVEIYSFDENVARPQNPDGSTTGELAFYPQTQPAQQVPVVGASIVLTPDVDPGNYLVVARIVWDAPEAAGSEQFTQYVFVVRVG